MKKLTMVCLSVLLAGMLCSRVTAYSLLDDNFRDVDIVTKDTYEPVEKDISKNMEDAAMNDGNKGIDLKYFRSADEPYWDIHDGIKSFYDAEGSLMYKHGSKMIIDVSKHNGRVDWEKVKAAGIDGAIIRLGYGYLGYDAQFVRNVEECNRLGIPYGVYLYSYAFDANQAYAEAEGTAQTLSKVKLNLSFPLYYDIENFDPWVDDDGSTRNPPKNAEEYEKVIGTYINRMSELGYAGKVHVYSYRSYLQGKLNSPKIHAYVSWTAAYTRTLGFKNEYYNGDAGWQYTSSGKINGISGKVDFSCFSGQMFNRAVSVSIPDMINSKLAEQGIKFNGGYLTGLQVGGDISSLVNQLSPIGVVTCFNTSGNLITSGKLATGQKVSVTITEGEQINTYTMDIIIRGDVNCDGEILANDYFMIKAYKSNTLILNTTQLKAADINNDGQVIASDYFMLKAFKENKFNIQQ